jgi:hypothetical protein
MLYNPAMSRAVRRIDLIRFLARIDQTIAETKALLAEPEVTGQWRALARMNLATQLKAQKRVEQLIGETA